MEVELVVEVEMEVEELEVEEVEVEMKVEEMEKVHNSSLTSSAEDWRENLLSSSSQMIFFRWELFIEGLRSRNLRLEQMTEGFSRGRLIPLPEF